MKLTISDCGKSKSEREADTVNQVVGTDADIDKVGFTHKEYEYIWIVAQSKDPILHWGAFHTVLKLRVIFDKLLRTFDSFSSLYNIQSCAK